MAGKLLGATRSLRRIFITSLPITKLYITMIHNYTCFLPHIIAFIMLHSSNNNNNNNKKKKNNKNNNIITVIIIIIIYLCTEYGSRVQTRRGRWIFFRTLNILSTSPPGGTSSRGSQVWDFRLVKEPQAWKTGLWAKFIRRIHVLVIPQYLSSWLMRRWTYHPSLCL